MKFVDLFAGLGGFHLAAGSLGGKCVFASEINESLRNLYKRNFGIEPASDITKVAPNEVPEHDLLCAGFPCQPFSKAGDQMGLEDECRGTVFWSVLEILRAKKPTWVLLENVPHFVRHDAGNTFGKIRTAMERAGYQVEYQQYSPHQFGVPQIRERVYMAAYRGQRAQFPWPTPARSCERLSVNTILDKNPLNATRLSRHVIRCIEIWQEFLQLIPADAKLPSFPIWAMESGATYPYDQGSLTRLPLRKLHKYRGSFGRSLQGLSRKQAMAALPSHARRSSNSFPKWKQQFIKQNRFFFAKYQKQLRQWLPKLSSLPSSYQKLEWNCQGEVRDIWQYLLQFRASGVRVKRQDTAPSLVAMTTTQIPIVAWERRYMTTLECARLQSMAKLREFPLGIAAMEALGNAVNVTVVRNILEPIAAEIDLERRARRAKAA